MYRVYKKANCEVISKLAFMLTFNKCESNYIL